MRWHNARPSAGRRDAAAERARALRLKRHYTWIIGGTVLPRLTRAADNATAARPGAGRRGTGGPPAGDGAPRDRQMRLGENTASSPVTRTQTFAEVIMPSRCSERSVHSASVALDRGGGGGTGKVDGRTGVKGGGRPWP